MAAFYLWICSFVAAGGSLAGQHLFGLAPCSWCIMQRLAALITFLLMTFYVAMPDKLKGYIMGVAQLSMVGGLAAATYQSYVHYFGDNLSCGDALNAKLSFFTMDYPSTAWLLEPLAMCSDANSIHFGLPLSMWSLLGFLIALIGTWLLSKSNPRII